MAEIKGVFFDLGGTLRIAYDLPSHQEKAKRRMAELAGRDDADAFLAVVEERYVPYSERTGNDPFAAPLASILELRHRQNPPEITLPSPMPASSRL